MIMSAFLIFVVLPIALIAYCILKRTLNKKIREYWKQTISANPEYLSQLELYRADEWELKRDEINLESEIGRGTFGKVWWHDWLSTVYSSFDLRFSVAMVRMCKLWMVRYSALVLSKLLRKRQVHLNVFISYWKQVWWNRSHIFA